MGIPHRLAAEYPTRCLQLLNAAEPYAREANLIGSFALLTATAILTIPFERSKAKHFLHGERDLELTKMIGGLEKVSFCDAPFWDNQPPTDWRQSHITMNFNTPEEWVARDGKHPLAEGAQDFLPDKKAAAVLRALRNALAHGNVVYLNKDGQEREGEPVHYLAFLSRYEEGEEQARAESYRLIVTTEEEFLRFVKCWAAWIGYQAIDCKHIGGA